MSAFTEPGNGWLATVFDTPYAPRGGARALHFDVDGTVTLVAYDGSSATITVKAGGCYPYRTKQVNSAGTSLSAGQIHGVL